MNDSSWGAPPHTGYWGPTDQGPAPAGPAYDARDAQHTRPMPVVPDVPDHGGDQDDDRGAARLSGPLFRDETFRDQTAQAHPYGEVPQKQDPEPMADAPQPAPQPQKKSAGRDLSAAIGVGVGLGAVIVASLFVIKAVFVGVVAVAVVVGLWELTKRLEERKGIRAPLVPLALGGAAMVVAGYVRGAEGAWVAMALTALAVLVWRMTEPPADYLRDVTAGVFAAFYVPFLATFVTMMLAADDGPWRVLTFLLLTVVSDTGAYAVGWRFGRRKLAPRISPGKTREGLLGAVAFAMAAGALCMQFLIEGGAWWQGLLLGLAVAASATLGDLGESMIKRDLGIKDMGTLLPGHGGIMDRLDSLLPTAPVVWLLLVLFVGSG
ncbi:phosphatidate cytidylyltransferase [Streptomyces sp. NPDC085946]|uniref:phosphatidate cytidylyltransferase n=1 Tax=Streptomyces sp. NPDC085946 TaxID=3365744 RepID=UPI0037CFE99C